MRISKGFLFLVIGGAVVCYRYNLLDRLPEIDFSLEKAKSWSQQQVSSNPIFKRPTALTDSRGRVLECQVLAKRGATIVVRRNSDQSQFLIPLRNLSQEDQARFSEVPDHRTEIVRSLEVGGSPALAANRKAQWNASLDQALGEARSTGLPIYLLFTGTDW